MTIQSISFTKMHGLGNDFVIVNNLDRTFHLNKQLIEHLADRHQGIGFDQLLVIEPSQNADFFCRIFNADGSEAKQCGNGLRSVARFLHEEKIHPKSDLTIETISGVYPIHIYDYDHIRAMMGIPSIQETLIDFSLNTSHTLPISIISTGNPHAIIKVNDVNAVTLLQLGPQISKHSHFPDGINVGFMQIIDSSHARLRTFERGVGETDACGSNACAAAVAGIINGWLKQPINIEFKHGKLTIEWEGADKPLYMTGPATRVFDGAYPIK